MPLQRKLCAITLDRPDPLALAAFSQQATGLEARLPELGGGSRCTRTTFASACLQ